VNLGVPLWTLLHSCTEVYELIALSFGVVAVISPGIGVFDGGQRAGKRGKLGGFGEFSPPLV